LRPEEHVVATKKITDEQRDLILKYVGMGWDKEEIAKAVGASKMQVAAVCAHRKMKTYKKSKYREATVSITPGTVIPGAQVEHYRHSESAILIGREIRSKDKIYWDPDPQSGIGNPHLMIIGESGYGKTYTAQCLIAELAQKNIPSVVFDYGQGFALNTAPRVFLESSNTIEILASERGIDINPLEIFTTDINGPINVAVRVSDTFNRIYNIGIQQHSVLQNAILGSFQDKGIFKEEKNTWMNEPPFLSNVKKKLDEMSTLKSFPDQKIAAKLNSHISTFFIFNTFRKNGEKISWEKIITSRKSAHILQLKGLEGKTGKVVTEFLLWDLYNYIVSQGPESLRFFCVLDEAHNLSFEKDSPVDKLVREGRKFGLGLIFASQQPEDFSSTAYSNTATKLVFQVLDDTRKVSKKLALKCMNFSNPAQVLEIISKLPRGRAFFVTQNIGSIVDVLSLEERSNLWSK
jgi:DNA phosphorothioation-dependent restriction protein DptH